jgi:hypothetical protein
VIYPKMAAIWVPAFAGMTSNNAKAGGAKRDRTADLLNAIQALSQLSYGPISKSESAIGISDSAKDIRLLLPPN